MADRYRGTTRFRGCCCTTPAVRADASGDAREGPRHLADLDLGARSPTRCARSPAASPRRASSAACISRSSATTGRACTGRWPRRRPGRHAGADVPGRAGRRVRLRAERRRDRLRHRRGPGAGRQAAGGEAAGARRSQHIYYDDPRGLRNYEGVTSFERLQEIGREFDRAHPGLLRRARSRKGSADDVSVMLYTSGTTGKPKGVCQTHARVHRRRRRAAASSTASTADDSILSYLPMAWVGDHLFSLRAGLVAGFTINCPESGDTVMTDLREIGPTYYFAPPRVFENLLTQVMIRMEDASAIKRGCSSTSWTSRAAAAPRSSTASRSALRDRLLLRARQPARLRAAAQRARHEPHPRRLHRGRGDRPRPVPLLPLDRHQPEAALRLDRDLRLRLPAAGRRRQVRHRRARRRPASR